MVSPSSSSLQLFSSSSSSSLRVVKLKSLIQTLIVTLARAMSRAKSRFLHVLKHATHQPAIADFRRSNKNKILFGSFRLHYNWCSSSSHVTPAPDTWEDYSVATAIAGDDGAQQLSGYLQWLEEREEKEKRRDCNVGDDNDDVNEIDKLAEIFIASCHEKFRLEKQESYRRFQEMMNRSF